MRGKKHKKAQTLGAAHAQTFHWPSKPPVPAFEILMADISHSAEQLEQCEAMPTGRKQPEEPQQSGINYDLDSKWEAPIDLDLDESDDMESLCELEGDKLEKNLAALKLIEMEKRKSAWKEVLGLKTHTDWKKAERGLGYTGHSDRTHRWREKDALDQAESCKKAKAS
ncbi:hypothetical protein SCLCIDRAFT_10318 [Scleroderma citrinum Foug A]|uniref:Uncharacterized protein n=1 Tax=Scleroderma citrinum Foug A TaxID=1036808 RepID=A0A0C3DPJ1_9AGAM|nr:hypothetical protein SCLCIDRAFT_10318 [Scleroderma citrinum Foug A]